MLLNALAISAYAEEPPQKELIYVPSVTEVAVFNEIKEKVHQIAELSAIDIKKIPKTQIKSLKNDLYKSLKKICKDKDPCFLPEVKKAILRHNENILTTLSSLEKSAIRAAQRNKNNAAVYNEIIKVVDSEIKLINQKTLANEFQQTFNSFKKEYIKLSPEEKSAINNSSNNHKTTENKSSDNAIDSVVTEFSNYLSDKVSQQIKSDKLSDTEKAAIGSAISFEGIL